MRIPNPRLVRLATIARGAIVEEGDGELVVSPVLQPVIELTAPIGALIAGGVFPAANFEDSMMKGEQLSAIGAAVAGSANLISLARGYWHIEWTGSFAFTGTTAPGNQSALFLQDPDGVQISFFICPHFNANFQTRSGQLHVAFQRDGFLFGITRAVTIAGDNAYIAGHVNCRRVI